MKKLILHEFLNHFRSYWTTSGHGGWRPVYAKELAGLPLSNVLSLYRFECVIRPQVVGILVHKVKKRSQKGGFDPTSGHDGTCNWPTCCHWVVIKLYFNFDILLGGPKQLPTNQKGSFLSKNTKKCHFRSQGGLGVKTTHVTRLTLTCPTKHQGGEDSLNPRLHAQNWYFLSIGG